MDYKIKVLYYVRINNFTFINDKHIFPYGEVENTSTVKSCLS